MTPRRSGSPAALLVVALALLFAAGATPAAAQVIDPATADVCALVPGEAVAAAVGGQLAEARPFRSPDGDFARCTYLISAAGRPDEPIAAYVVYLYRDSEYDPLLAVHEGPVENVADLGDAAILFQDQDQRWKLRFVRRGRYTLETTSPDPEGARKLARLAFDRL